MKKQYIKFLERKLAKLRNSAKILSNLVEEKSTAIDQLDTDILKFKKIISNGKAENERQLKEIHQARNLIEANEILRAECKRLEGIIICNNGNG